MNVLVLVAVIFGVSCLTQTMVPITARNGQILGPYWAAGVFLVVGAVTSAVILLARSDGFDVRSLAALPWLVYVNGFFNILVLAAIAELVPRLGVGVVWSAAVLGQITAGLTVDHLGALGVPVAPLNGVKLAGVGLIMAGQLLFTLRQRTLAREHVLAVARPHASFAWPFLPRYPTLVGGALLVGVSQTLMGTINAQAGQTVGPIAAVTLFLALGALLSLAVCLVFQRARVSAVAQLPWYAYAPGLVNVLTVGLPTILIPLVGVGIFTATSFVGQAFAALLADSIGFLGMPRVRLARTKAIGACCMGLGVVILRGAVG